MVYSAAGPAGLAFAEAVPGDGPVITPAAPLRGLSG